MSYDEGGCCFQIHGLRWLVFRRVHRRLTTAVHSAGLGDCGTVLHGASRGVVREKFGPEGLAGTDKERGLGRVGGRHAPARVWRYTLAGGSIFQRGIYIQRQGLRASKDCPQDLDTWSPNLFYSGDQSAESAYFACVEMRATGLCNERIIIAGLICIYL